MLRVSEKSVKTILQRSGISDYQYSANPYVGCPHGCRYCYASCMSRDGMHRAPWGQYLDVKLWDTSMPLYNSGGSLIIGSVTDPYNPYEEKYNVTRKLLTQLEGTRFQITIVTKSDLVLRDIDILLRLPNVRVVLSVNTLEKEFQQDMDKAVSIDRRLAALCKLRDYGISTVCFIAPIFPKITDVPEIIYTVKDYCNEIWLENLKLSGTYRADILEYIMEKYPELMGTYDAIYGNRNYTYWHRLESQIEGLCKLLNLPYKKENELHEPEGNSPVVVNCFYHTSQRRR